MSMVEPNFFLAVPSALPPRRVEACARSQEQSRVAPAVVSLISTLA